MRPAIQYISFAIILCLYACGTDKKPDAATSSSSSEPKKEETVKTVVTDPETAESKVVERAELLSGTIMLNSINYGWINERLLEKVNAERRILGLPEFTFDSGLGRAARMHNNHMVATGILDHTQTGTKTPQMRDRLKLSNSKLRTAGENIQFEGFTIRTTNGIESIIPPTYEELAEQLWQNWKTSPPHYENISNPEYTYIGTALKWSDDKKAIFATQLYGGN